MDSEDDVTASLTADTAAELEAALPIEDDAEAPLLPSLDFMRGYTTALPAGAVIDANMREWLDALIGEVEHIRALMIDSPSGNRTTLTPAEIRVYRYLRNTRMAYGEIANECYVSINTVKTHGKNIFRKLGVTRRAELRDLDNL